MREFKPTYLMIKQHSVTGKLYFCKTTRSYEKMLKYTGSGKYWQPHIKKHSKEYVETIWYCLFYDKETIKEFALMCSEQWNIVKSKEWTNFKPEDGLDGGRLKGCKGHKSWNKGRKFGPRSEETCSKISLTKTGERHTKEHANNISISRTGGKYGPYRLQLKLICPHCGKIGGSGNMKRYHFDNCKCYKIQEKEYENL